MEMCSAGHDELRGRLMRQAAVQLCAGLGRDHGEHGGCDGYIGCHHQDRVRVEPDHGDDGCLTLAEPELNKE